MIDRLKEYIKKDEMYQEYKNGKLTNASDFDKFCIQHCKDIEELLEENEELKSQLKGTTHCYDEEEHRQLKQENAELKKELKDTIEELELVRCDLHNRTSERNGAEKQNDLYKIQQQEFIKYLEEPIKIIIDGNPTNISEYTMGKFDTLKEVLRKYKEIIGVKDEK